MSASPSISRSSLLFLALLFVATTAWTWASWGHVRVDTGGALHRAEKISEGAVLYRDVQVHYPPLAPYAMGAILAVFGKHLNVVYATGLILLLLQSCLLWRIGRCFLDERETTVGVAAFWLLLAFQPGLFNWVLPNVFAGTFASLLATAVVAVILRDVGRPENGNLILASLLTGGAGLAKLEYGGAAFGTLAFYVLVLRPVASGNTASALRRRAADLLRAGLPGLALGLAAFGLVALTVPVETILYDNIYRIRSFSDVLDNYTASLFPPLLPEFGKAALTYLVFFPLAAAIASLGLGWLRRGGFETAGGVFILILAATITYLVSRHLSPDEERSLYVQFQFTWTPIAWLGLGAAALLLRERLAGDKVWRVLAVLGLFSFLVTLRWQFRVAWPAFYAVFGPFLVIWIVRQAFAFLAPRAAHRSAALAFVLGIWIATGTAVHARDYRARTFELTFDRGTIFTTPRDGKPMKRTIDFLRMQLEPGQYVAVIPEEQLINFMVDATHPTRDTGIGPGWLATRDDEERFLRELAEKDTPFVIFSNRRYIEFKVGGLDGYEPWLTKEIYRRYVPVAKTRFYRILERKDRVDRRRAAEAAKAAS
ncbi:MAG: hypothetical protein VCC00_14570 [Deltaproteobacteria bacterium]